MTATKKGGFKSLRLYYFVISLICVIVSHNKILVVYRTLRGKGAS
jgi:hypothetical protein